MRRRVGRLRCRVGAAFAEAVLSAPRTVRRGRPWPPWVAVHAAECVGVVRLTRAEVAELDRVARALGVAPAVAVVVERREGAA